MVVVEMFGKPGLTALMSLRAFPPRALEITGKFFGLQGHLFI